MFDTENLEGHKFWKTWKNWIPPPPTHTERYQAQNRLVPQSKSTQNIFYLWLEKRFKEEEEEEARTPRRIKRLFAADFANADFANDDREKAEEERARKSLIFSLI